MAASGGLNGVGAVAEGGELVLEVDALPLLLHALGAGGRRVIGPVVRDGAVVLDELRSVDDLPRGWRDVQAPGSYRVERTDGVAFFAWAVGPQSVKAQLFPPRATEWRARLDDGGFTLDDELEADGAVAVLGARPCELAALAVLDGALGTGSLADPRYRRRRTESLVVVVECGSPSGSCFCTSMGTGPAAGEGFDLALTELADVDGHRFLVRVGSPSGAAVLDTVPTRAARPEDRAARDTVLGEAAGHMGRSLDTDGLPALLMRNLENPRWDEVAERCLACGNCTLVCPTCFCSTVEDVSSLDGTVERHRSWASCFDLAHSYVHGGPVRQSTSSRYRQWLTHKLSTWWDQFGTSGCVGCGRCITWCPVGIDLTEEAAAIRATDGVVHAPAASMAAGEEP